MNTDSRFQEKLNTLYQCIFGDVCKDDMTLVNKPCGHVVFEDLPEPLRLFYATFADKKDFMKCLYDIKLPDEVAIENNIMIIARERQGVCAYGVEIDNGRVIYLDDSNRVAESLNMQIDDFILYLIAIQCSGFCSCTGKIYNCFSLLEESYRNQRITNNSDDGAVYFFGEGVILAVNGKDAYVSSKDDSIMELFEEDTTFDVDYF